jgi:hypothetical protein
MQDKQKSPTRKKFLLLTAAAFCSATVLRFFRVNRKKSKYTVKMLTQDGRLVEIDRDKLSMPGKKITNDQLQRWVHHKNPQQ